MADAPRSLPPTPARTPALNAQAPPGLYVESPITYPPFPAPPMPSDPQLPPPMPLAAPGLPPRDLRNEYVATSASPWWLPARRLTWYIDDLTSEFGDDLYERMLVDPQVASCIAVLKTAIVEEGVHLTPPMSDKDDPDYACAQQLADIATRMLEDLESSLDDILYDMLDGIAMGNRVAELKFALLDDPPGYDGGPLLNLVNIKPKPRRTTAFVTDNYGNVIGLLGLPPYTSPSLLTIDLNVLQSPFLLPRNKFCVYTFRPRSADPRGTSVLRPAYPPWWRKQQIWPEYFKYLTQFGGGALVLKASASAQPQFPVDPVTLEPIAGMPPITPEQLLLTAAEQFRNGAAMAVPAGTEVDVIHPPGEGKAFVEAYKMCNLEITKAILLQNLATEEGEHQARAAAQVHQDILDTVVRQAKRALQRMIHFDILRPWVLYNWGAKLLDLTPHVSLGTTEEQDLGKLWSSAASLMTAGYLATEQLPAMDDKLGLPIRDLSTMEPSVGPDGAVVGAGAAPGLPTAGGPGAVGVAAGGPGQPNVGAAGAPQQLPPPPGKDGQPAPGQPAPGQPAPGQPAPGQPAADATPPAPPAPRAGGAAPPPGTPPAPGKAGPSAPPPPGAPGSAAAGPPAPDQPPVAPVPPGPPAPPAKPKPPPQRRLPKPSLQPNERPEPPGDPAPNPQQQGDPSLGSPLAPIEQPSDRAAPVRQPLEAPQRPASAPGGGGSAVRGAGLRGGRSPVPVALSATRLPQRAVPPVTFGADPTISDADLAAARAWAEALLAGTPVAGLLTAQQPPPPPLTTLPGRRPPTPKRGRR